MDKLELPTPPWQTEKKSKRPKMLLCHFANGELEGFDNLQGGPSIDPKTGIREYSSLSKIIKIPEVREIFHHVANEVEQHGKVSPSLEKIYESTKKNSLPFRESPDEESNPEIRDLEQKGRRGDTKVAWIPYDVAQFLIELSHVPSVNPATGLLEFGNFLKNAVRIAGSVAGAVIGGAPGAAIGRGLAGIATGENRRKAFSAALTHGSRAAFISGLGGALGSIAPGMTGSLGNMVGPGMAGAAGNFFNGPMSTMGLGQSLATAAGLGGSAGVAGATGATGVGGTAGGAAGAMGARTAAGAPGQGSLLGSLGSFLSSPAAIMAGTGALAYMGSKKQYKHEKDQYDRDAALAEKYREDMGFNRDFTPSALRRRKANTAFHGQDPSLTKYGSYTESPFSNEYEPVGYAHGGNVRSYNKGALVKGPGNGQDDKIKTSVPEGSYIIDASSTSMFGDGSSEAGANRLKRFEQQIKRSIPKPHYIEIEQKTVSRSPQLPVWLSNDEYKFDPITVSILGGGSNAKGSKMLKQMVKNLRSQKNGNADRLPPKAKDPMYYIRER